MKEIEYHSKKLITAVSPSLRQKTTDEKKAVKNNLTPKTESKQPSFYTKPIFKERKYIIW